jgi:3-hydroxyacyl-[acyl-carrier-protein] dehydratase
LEETTTRQELLPSGAITRILLLIGRPRPAFSPERRGDQVHGNIRLMDGVSTPAPWEWYIDLCPTSPQGRSLSVLSRSQIEGILPHRPPFLFVDAVSEIVPGERIVGEFRVKETELFLTRDGAGESRLPPTILTEAMAQVGAILVLFPEENRGRTIYFRSIEEAEFRKPLLVGTTVRVEAKVKKLRSRFGSLEVEARAGDSLIARGVMSFALG